MRYSHFTKSDRIELSILLKKGYSMRDIGKALKKNPSSISREVNENSVNSAYDSIKAHHKAYIKRKYSKYQGMKIRDNPGLEKYIQSRLVKRWTPEEIAGRLKSKNDNQTVISFKSIYGYLETPFGEPFKKYLPLWSKRRTKRKKKKKNYIKGRTFIHKRPNIINSRIRCGDFEGDTLGVPKTCKSTVVGMVDRRSLFFLGKKISRLKETINTFKKIINKNTVLSLTLDNGIENIPYKKLNTPTYFCHPYCSWEKAIIENTFQRLRRFIPKKASLDNYSNNEISDIIDKMNDTPRKTLGFRKPREVFFEEIRQMPIQLTLFNNIKCCTSG